MREYFTDETLYAKLQDEFVECAKEYEERYEIEDKFDSDSKTSSPDKENSLDEEIAWVAEDEWNAFSQAYGTVWATV